MTYGENIDELIRKLDAMKAEDRKPEMELAEKYVDDLLGKKYWDGEIGERQKHVYRNMRTIIKEYRRILYNGLAGCWHITTEHDEEINALFVADFLEREFAGAFNVEVADLNYKARQRAVKNYVYDSGNMQLANDIIYDCQFAVYMAFRNGINDIDMANRVQEALKPVYKKYGFIREYTPEEIEKLRAEGKILEPRESE